MFDSSCNTLSEETTHKLDENPAFKPSSQLLISNYFLNRAKQTEDIHGGTRKTNRKIFSKKIYRKTRAKRRNAS